MPVIPKSEREKKNFIAGLRKIGIQNDDIEGEFEYHVYNLIKIVANRHKNPITENEMFVALQEVLDFFSIKNNNKAFNYIDDVLGVSDISLTRTESDIIEKSVDFEGFYESTDQDTDQKDSGICVEPSRSLSAVTTRTDKRSDKAKKQLGASLPPSFWSARKLIEIIYEEFPRVEFK